MGTSMDFSGFDRLNQRIKELGIKASRAENKALNAGGDVLQKAISERAPRSDHPRQPTPGTQSWRTGEHAADHIKKSKVKTVDGVKVLDVGIQPGDNSHYFYLKFAEYGTSKQAAKPFVGPAVAESQDEAINAMKDELKKGLKL